MNKKLFSLIFALTATFSMNAQNFSGHYIMLSKETIVGKEYWNSISKDITVIQTKDSLKIIRVTEATGGKVTTITESLPLNGKTILLTTLTKRNKTATMSFDKPSNTVTIIYLLSFSEKPNEIEYKNVEVWSLNNDGTLTITKTSDATITDDWSVKAVFKAI